MLISFGLDGPRVLHSLWVAVVGLVAKSTFSDRDI